jgi:pyruvate dehydrogenase E2 component (dihydrolipoamide acetyltransferase)
VARGEIIAIVESDKANVELESAASGILLETLFEPDTEIKVGTVIARVGQPEEGRSSFPTPSTRSPAPDISPVAKRLAEERGVDLSRVVGSGRGGRVMREDVEALLKPGKDGRVRALPKVRKAAREAGIDLALVPATGAHGQVTLDDLAQYQRAHAPAATPAPTPEIEGRREIALSRARRTIGERLSRSMREAPHFYVSGEFDVTDALRALPGKIRINDLLLYLTAQTLLRVPELNATYEDDRLFRYDHVHLGIAVALEDGLLTPVLRHAERYSLQGIADESRSLIERAREKRLRPDDLQGGTFTVSNLGVVKQVERFTAVINPPQVGILAVGTVKERPVVIDGGLHIRSTVYLTVSGDHRAVDGMHLARFLAVFQEQLTAFSK